MTPRRALVMVLVAALLVMAFQPAPAEALEPTVILAIAGVAVLVVTVIAILVIANVEESRRASATPSGLPEMVRPEMAIVLAYAPPAAGDVSQYSAP